jgi:hypothetical protein
MVGRLDRTRGVPQVLGSGMGMGLARYRISSPGSIFQVGW